MKSRRRFSFRWVMLGAAFSGSVLLAQPATDTLGIRPGSLEATVFAGVSAANNGEKEGDHLQIENSVPLGGRIGYNFDKHNAVEFSIANPLSFSANYLYHFSPIHRRWAPYATAGVGGSRYGLALAESDSAPANVNSEPGEAGPERRQTAFTGNFGGGVEYFLSNRFALRFDARDIVGRYNATFANVLSPSGGPAIKVGRTLNDFQFTVGFVFRFAGR